MTNPANDIVRQASQGSVAAIIQVLNERLAESGVRTRAFFAHGVLQLLCEGATSDMLEKTTLIERVRQILEAIAPRNIRRVNINSRIICEQQLLWLEEINRDPATLLWSEEITLNKPNLLQQLLKDWKYQRDDQSRTPFPKAAPRRSRDRQQFQRGLVGGASLSLLLIVGWVLYDKLGRAILLPPSARPTPQTIAPTQPSTQPTPQADPFVSAVRIAEQASRTGTQAKSSAEWLDLAARWQQASDLMAAVPPSDGRYKTAQDRVALYRQNSESALNEARRKQTESSGEIPDPTLQASPPSSPAQ